MVHSQFRIEWVDKYLASSPQIIFDVGTFDGGDAVRFKEKWPGAKVVAFEACPDNYRQMILGETVTDSGVEIVHKAVCDHSRGVVFHSNVDQSLSGGAQGCSGSILPPTDKLKSDHPHLTWKAGRSVRSTRLDDFCREQAIKQIDLLHIDVQGAELFVLYGLGALRPSMIFLEINETEEAGHYAGAGRLKDIRAWMGNCGYEVKLDSGSDALYVLGDRQMGSIRL
jgi:FkbM family methyltransferase